MLFRWRPLEPHGPAQRRGRRSPRLALRSALRSALPPPPPLPPLPAWLRLAWHSSRREALLIVLLSAAAAPLAALQPLPLKLLIDHALGPTPLPAWLSAGLPAALQGGTALIVIAALASLLFSLLSAALEGRLLLAWALVGQGSTLALSERLLGRLLALKPCYHQRQPVGDSLQRLFGDSYSVYSAADQLLVTPARQLLTLAAIALVAWQLDAGLTLLSFTMVPLLLLLARRGGAPLRRRLSELRETEAGLLSFTHQTLAALPLVQAFQREASNRRRFAELSAEATSRTHRQQLLRSLIQLAGGLVGSIAAAVVLAAGSRRVLAGELGVGSLVVLLGYLSTIQASLLSLLEAFAARQGIRAGLQRVEAVLESREAPSEPTTPQTLPGGRAQGRLRIEGLRLRHSSPADGSADDPAAAAAAAGHPALDGVSFSLEPGELVALVGATGSGKSSLVGCLLRWFDPDEGRILLDGIDIRSLALSSLRRQISLVPQQPRLAPLTIADTIAYGNPEATPDQISAAARMAAAEAFISQLPHGYGTRIGERGANLSGGERQRLALARAFCKSAPILVLDEPTAALDGLTERQVLAALTAARQGRTTLLVTHRLSSARLADRLVLLERGRVIEQGAPTQLLAGDGPTARLLRSDGAT